MEVSSCEAVQGVAVWRCRIESGPVGSFDAVGVVELLQVLWRFTRDFEGSDFPQQSKK